MPNVMAKARQFAREKKPLDQINYLDKHGRSAARGRNIKQIELIFGEEILLMTPQELGMLKDVAFNLQEDK